MMRQFFKHAIRDQEMLSILQKERVEAIVELPEILKNSSYTKTPLDYSNLDERLKDYFPKTWGGSLIEFIPNNDDDATCLSSHTPLRIGVVLSGGQAPGGHTVISGIFDRIKQKNSYSQVFGFLKGPSGVYEQRFVEITSHIMDNYRNLGGFDMIQSGRHKIDTLQQKKASLATANKLDLHGIVIIGGDDSNTNACILAEYFEENNAKCRIIGVPKTIDGDLRTKYIEASFGFDTAVKTYSEYIGNLMCDIATSRKYYHFVRLMGRSASNITLHCALLTRPNLCFIGEEVLAKRLSLNDLVDIVVALVLERQSVGKDYGVVVVPEGLIEFIPEMRLLIKEINFILANPGAFNVACLTPDSQKLYNQLPKSIAQQLLIDRDPHGNVMVSRIATERLLILMVVDKLNETQRNRFIPRSHFFGYEGRSGLPSVFDSTYCYALGHTAAELIDIGATGQIACVKNLAGDVSTWKPFGVPLTSMLSLDIRGNKCTPVIEKYLVELDKEPFLLFKQARQAWRLEDYYSSPGPIQFEGPFAKMSNWSIAMPTSLEQLIPPRDRFYLQENRVFFRKSFSQLSLLEKSRLEAPIRIPNLLKSGSSFIEINDTSSNVDVAIGRSFPLLTRQSLHKIFRMKQSDGTSSIATTRKMLRVGVFLNGQQASGCANVLIGLWNVLESLPMPCTLYGFLNGVTGFTSDPPSFLELNSDLLYLSRNMGGFELLGREKESELFLASNGGINATERVCRDMKLDGLVVIGGRYTLTDCAILSEELLRRDIKTSIIAVPATQNNNISCSILECSIGFDSASKCYSHLIGNLNTDSASSAKYWLFVRLMGACKSQIAVETALSTNPNIVLVAEAYAAGDKTLNDVVNDIADVIVARSENGLEFGTVLIPEGLVSSLPEFRHLITELKSVFNSIKDAADIAKMVSLLVEPMDYHSKTAILSSHSFNLLKELPPYFRQQLLQPRCVENVEMTKVATEELIADMVGIELIKREKLGKSCHVNFAPLCFFFGYQCRSVIPSNFDCSLGYSHGALAAQAIINKKTGYVTVLKGLGMKPELWIPELHPITSFLKNHSTDSFKVPNVPSDMVNLHTSRSYKRLQHLQESWENQSLYVNPGPVQFFGKTSCNSTTSTLTIDQGPYLEMLEKVKEKMTFLRGLLINSGISETELSIAGVTLNVLLSLYRNEDITTLI